MARTSASTWRTAEHRLAAQYAVTRALAEARTLHEATHEILAGVCDSLGWEFGALWRPDDSGDELECVATWHAGADMAGFDDLSRSTRLRRGAGLPGRVWASGKPAWIPDVVADRNFPRAPGAAKEGLHAGFAFPIVLEGTVLGVVEFLSTTIIPPDEELLATGEVIGSQIGQFIERIGAEAAVRASEARHAAILQSALDCVITMDHKGNVLEFNPAAEIVFGYRRDEAVGREMCELIIPSRLREQHRRGLARYLETGEGPVLGRRIELTGMRADGSEFDVELAITRVALPGPPVFTGYLRDITDRKASEAALRQSQAQLDAVIRTIGDAVLVFDERGRLVLKNPAAETLLGGRVTTIRELFARFDPEPDPSRRDALLEPAATAELRLKDDPRWLELTTYALGSNGHHEAATRATTSGQPSRILVLRDISATKREQAARDAFLGVLSHELRTPITTIYAGSEVLARRNGSLSDDSRGELFDDIKTEAARLKVLVEDLLVLSRVERGGIETGREPILLQRILPAVVASEQKRWPATRFQLEIPLGLPTVQGDATYVEQIARNLIANAAKYSPPESSVVVNASQAEARVEIRVLDEGPGFRWADKSRLFDLFYRAPEVAGKASGAGIGLFVARQLAEAMGGTIWAARRPEGGSEFGFSLRQMPD